jgi:hypothetical protein
MVIRQENSPLADDGTRSEQERCELDYKFLAESIPEFYGARIPTEPRNTTTLSGMLTPA